MNITLKTSEKADKFAYIFQNMKLFAENINIMFETNRVYIQAMDQSRISIFEVEIANSWFDVYTREDTNNVRLGINANLFYKILATREKTQDVSIHYSDNNSDELEISFHSENKAIFDKYFTIPLIEIDEQLMEIPENEGDAEITLNSTNFANIVSQLKLFGDAIEIHCSEEEILFTSYSTESGKMKVKVDIDDIDSFAINEGAELHLAFNLSNLNNICTYHKICKDVNIKWIRDFPMQISYSIDNSLVNLKFYLAPKIADD